jgi:phosphatidylglycerol lysyltransferase
MILTRRNRIGLWATVCLTVIVGVVNLLSAVSPSVPERVAILRDVFSFHVRASGHLFSALSGFILLTLAASLLRRKRVAWLITIALLIVSIVSHLIKGLDYEEGILSAILLIQLVLMRHVFTARSDRPSIAQGVRVLLVALGFTLAYGTAGFYILDGRFQISGQPVNFGFMQSILQTLNMFFTEDNAGLEPQGRFASFFANSIYLVGALTLASALFMLLRPVLLRGEPATSDERQQAREIIDRHGQTSLARLSLLKDKSYYFSPSNQSVIAYVAKGRAAIALGDPIGPPADRREAITSFQQFCDRNDWFPAFYEVSSSQVDLYLGLGFHLLQVGEEASIDLTTFSLQGKANQNLRTALNKFSKTGYQVQIHQPPIAEELLQQLKPISDEWLKDKQGAEKQFSIGWFDPDYLRECLIGVLYNSDQEAVAFITMMSGYNQPEVTVDLMRYCSHLPNGAMECLFTSVFQQLQQQSWQRFNFSLSPLAGVGEAPDSRRAEKALHYLSQHLNQFYNFQGLHNFKEKFRPQWEPRYLAYPGWAALPDVVVGLVRADSGDRLIDYFKTDA